MEAKEAPERKFVYPDKLYARCKDNKTLDISYAPQNMEAAEYTRIDAFIEKARKWFERQYEWYDKLGVKHCDMKEFEDFVKYIEEE